MAGLLTKDLIEDVKLRARKYWESDGLNGLSLLVMPNGAKYWKFRYRFNGKSDELTAAEPYPRGTLDAARKEARRLQVMVDSGRNPREERKLAKVAARRSAFHRFEQAANAWHEFRSRAWAKQTSDQVHEYLDRDIIPRLGRRPLDEITADELADLLHGVNERAADVAKKARQWLSAIYSYARAKQWTTADPARDLRIITLLGAESRRHPHLPLEDMPAFLPKLKEVKVHPSVKGAAWMAIWTGNRPGVTHTLRWSEVDLVNALWTIPRGRAEMKRGHSHVTPLSTQVVRHQRDLQWISGTFDHVFVGRNDPGKPISDGAAKGMLERMGYGGRQTMHGFRHVASSALNGMGYPADQHWTSISAQRPG